jgi:hypothetical protein
LLAVVQVVLIEVAEEVLAVIAQQQVLLLKEELH